MSNAGTNDYNAQKLTPSEQIVSRTLQSKNRFWSNVVWRTGKPVLDSEWNLINDLNLEVMNNLVRSTTPSGWLSLGPNRYVGNSNVANNFEFYAHETRQVLDVPNVVVNGWPIIVGGVNFTDTSLNSVTLGAAGAILDSQRWDFVFLEVWKAQVRSRDENNNKIAQNKPNVDEIYAYGNVQYGGTHFPDDIVDPAIKPSTDGIETTQRVQLQYRVRVVENTTFPNNFSPGFDDALVQGQGANPNPQTGGYQFTNMAVELNDSGLWRCGSGDEASRTALRTVDGYAYAIPMFRVYRRSQVPYSDTGVDAAEAFKNQQGNAAALASGISDRPDGKFHDGVEAVDIIDMRYKVSMDGFDYQKIMEENLHLVFSGDLESSRRGTLQYDSIGDSDIYGYTDFRNNEGASGKRKVWSDAATVQPELFSEIETTTSDNTLDVYVVKNDPNPEWRIGDQIIVQSTPRLPLGTSIRATPRIFIEEKDPFATDLSTSGVGTWSGLNTNVATFSFTSSLSHSKNLWVYYDTGLPEGQGLSQVGRDMLEVRYPNFALLSPGVVVRGEYLVSPEPRMQDLANHPFENAVGTDVYREIAVATGRKQIDLMPMIQTTTVRDGNTRTLSASTTDKTAKIVSVPYRIQHLKGIYTAQSGGTELASQTIFNTQVDGVDDAANSILVDVDYYICELTSLKYDPSGAFVGAETELLVANGGSYNPVYEHRRVSGQPFGSRVRLYNTSGEIFDMPTGTSPTNFRWSGRRIAIRGGTGYGFDINEMVIDCSSSDNNASFNSMIDGQELWVDMDYLGAPHEGAEIRMIYSYTPYQGSDIGAQELRLEYKRENGIFFNNGTGGGNVSVTDSSGTSNRYYTPLSPKLPGSFNDFLRDGAVIDVTSRGTKRYDSDIIFKTAYDLYGYFGGGVLWAPDYTMPPAPETSSRGFLGNPFVEVLFELPSVDQTYAEFILPLLVKDRQTGEILLLVQIGNKGVQKLEDGPVFLEIYRLREKLLSH